MENLKKNPLSLQLNVEDFAPASNDEKKSLVVMRESVNFWKDGMRRLRKNKIAMVSLVVILLIAFMAYVLPSFWPYSYEQQIKGSNNLAPFEYSAAEQKLIDQGENVFPHILGTDRMGRDFCRACHDGHPRLPVRRPAGLCAGPAHAARPTAPSPHLRAAGSITS